MASFVQSARLGKSGERLVLDILTFAAIPCKENLNTVTREFYDLEANIGSKKFTIECKYDWYSEKSGNLAIEFFNSTKNKPSGIDNTKANLWAIIINDKDYKTIWITSVSALKAYIKAHTAFKTIMKAGDGNASIYLYKTEQLLSIFKRIDNLEKEQIVDVVKGLLKKGKNKVLEN